jgi:glyoxylase-like metal-dependent hydrolase (beta-lactamase superfamily II)
MGLFGLNFSDKRVFVAFFWLVGSGTAVASEAADPFDVQFLPVADGIFMAYRPKPERQPVMGNGTIILNQDRVLVVDGNGSPLFAERVVAGVKARTTLPVTQLVVTSWHGDHNLGNRRFLDAWPELELVGHRLTRKAMLGPPMRYVQEVRTNLGPQIEALKGIAASGQLPDGRPVPPYLREDFADLASFGDLMLAEIQQSEVIAPQRLFDDKLLFNDGGRQVMLLHPGKAYTAGDTAVWLPAERLLVTGDLVVAPTPFATGSYPRAWALALRQLLALQPAVIIPGHGPLMRDTHYLELLLKTLEYIASEAEQAVTSGQTLEQFRAGFDWQDLPYRFTGNNPVLTLRWEQWFAGPVLEAAHNEARGVDSTPLD